MIGQILHVASSPAVPATAPCLPGSAGCSRNSQNQREWLAVTNRIGERPDSAPSSAAADVLRHDAARPRSQPAGPQDGRLPLSVPIRIKPTPNKQRHRYMAGKPAGM